MIDVAIVEDNTEVRETLALFINESDGFNCENVYSDCESALAKIPETLPDVVLMDLGLPGKSGIEGIQILKRKLPNLDIIVLTIQEDDESVFESLRYGACGYLLKNTDPNKILTSIKEVLDGGSPMSSAIARKVISSFHTNDHESPLSIRETEVLKKLCEGQNYKVIADSLFVSGNTVRMHIKNIYKKLHVHSRGEAVKKAIEDRLI
ncbi:MAG: response regulator transcription factor [Ignavibacteriae bacterium]|nr:response regulator transcription factor [Ignavibacteriota bacterium]MCB9208856.1 response regulator transcription factor [Ignavibacteriales bacterium]MCB9218226.1 response regulator transcription factor [Ignavibacteriales bacterium]MCB9260727.1 response regulator transcription factor [Ignavibacteriales bacterium]